METKNLSTFEKTWGVLIPILVYKISTAFFAMVLLTLTDTLSRHGLIPSTVLSENSGFLSVLIRALSHPEYCRTVYVICKDHAYKAMHRYRGYR